MSSQVQGNNYYKWSYFNSFLLISEPKLQNHNESNSFLYEAYMDLFIEQDLFKQKWTLIATHYF